MRTCGSRAEIQFGKTQMRHGTGYCKAAEETAAHVLAMSTILLPNLRRIQCAFLRLFECLMTLFVAHVKLAFVQ